MRRRMSTSSIEPVFDAFLAALCDPEGGDALYNIHAPAAFIRYPHGAYSSTLGPLQDVDRVAFASAHRELSLQGHNALPRFVCTSLLRAPVETGDAADAVGWFEITETREARSLIVGVGVKTITGMPRIGWCTLATSVQPWSYEEGLLHSVADYPWMRVLEPARARVLLDASYFRLYWRPEVKFTALPDARFSCRMSTDCCKHDFEITLPPEAQLLIDAMPWRTLRPELEGTRLPMRPDGKLQLKSLNETCRFLGARNQCLIHQTLGRQPFGPCSVFPFALAHTPDGVAVSMSPICGTTRLGLGLPLAGREEDLRERLVQAEPRRADRFHLAPAAEISWEQFRDIEKLLCAVLAEEELPMRRRLYVGARFLGALRNGEPVDMNHWLAEPPIQITGELREAIRGMLAKVLAWDRATLKALPQTIPEGLASLEMLEPAVIGRILRNTLFCKAYSYTFDLTTAYNFLIVLYLLALIMQESSPGTLSDAMWRELGSLGVHGLLKGVLHEGVPDGFRTIFGTAEFGQWLLVA